MTKVASLIESGRNPRVSRLHALPVCNQPVPFLSLYTPVALLIIALQDRYSIGPKDRPIRNKQLSDSLEQLAYDCRNT